ncbi:MAG: serine protease [Thiohalocapsa sp.]
MGAQKTSCFAIHSENHRPNVGAQQRHAIRLLCLALLALPPAPEARAEIYRYQDTEGNWIFSDRPQHGTPPEDQAAQPALPSDAIVDDRHDLATRLEQRFQPVSAVESSSLAVLKVNSPIGTGSGFFVSQDGLILTNRHVIKPPDDWAKKLEEHLELIKRQLDALERKLSHPRGHYADPKQYDRGKRLLRDRSLEYRQAKRELEMRHYAAQLQNAFEVELKDGSLLSADLVDVSSNHDLALLRLKGYRTPYIVPTASSALRQTDRVYAIGSPLGISDTITIGTYTGTRKGLLVTDARILPGNSGGPMVNEMGAAVGVNTLKATAGSDPNERGFGLAIPIEIAFDEFTALQR